MTAMLARALRMFLASLAKVPVISTLTCMTNFCLADTLTAHVKVMSSDAALVQERDRMNGMCDFIRHHGLPEDIARDVITAFHDQVMRPEPAMNVFRALSPALQREVAMHVSLHLIKGCDVFSQCSIGFTSSLAVIMR